MAGTRVLVVEDDPLLAFELMEDLQTAGAVPLGPLSTVETALSFVDQVERIDAALVNVVLRRQLAFPVVDALRSRGVPVVFVTGDEKAVRERFPEVPVHSKPVNSKSIIMNLATVARGLTPNP